jgi:hypothetical protein
MAYLGRNPAVGTQKMLDSIESQFNGVLTTFDLRYGGVPTYPTLSESLIVSLGGVLQEPGQAYYASSDTIVFSEAPQTGTECWILLYSEYGAGIGSSQQGDLGANNLTLTGQLRGPSTFIIDPATVGDDTGDVVIKGNLTVQGATTTINSTTLTVDDKNIVLGDSASPTDALADGGGITLKGATDKTINWIDATDAWTSSERFSYPLGSAAAPALTFTGDPNTGIYSPGADQLALSTAGTGRLFVDASGRLGVGASVPADALHLASGNFRLTNGAAFTTANSLIRSVSSFAGSANQFETTRISFITGAFVNRGEIAFSTGDDTSACVEKVRIDYLGRVGIGTTGPNVPLQVIGGSTVTDPVIRATNSGATQSMALMSGGLRMDGGAPIQIYQGGTEVARIDASGGFQFKGAGTAGVTQAVSFNGSAPVNSLVIDSSGRLGVGTSSPNQKLEVAGGTIRAGDNQATNGSLILDGNYAGSDTLNTFGSQFSSASTVIGYAVRPRAGATGYTSTAGSYSFHKAALEVGIDGPLKLLYSPPATTPIGNVVTMTEMLRVDTAGRVGIGTTSPTAKLDVRGPAYFVGSNTGRSTTIDTSVYIKGELGGWVEGYYFRGSSSTDLGGFGIYGNNDTTTYFWIGPSYSSPSLVVASNGNVGIGTNAPTTKLNVNGGARFTNSSSASSIISNTAIWADTPLQTVSAFFGNVASVSSLTGDQYSTSIRFNGADVSWGDLSYYPNEGGKGHFRFSLTGNSVVTDPNAKLGVGGLYVAGNVGIGVTNPLSKLHVTGQLQTANPSTYSAITGIGIGNSYPIYCTEVNAGSGGFTPFLLQRTLVTGGYRQILSIGSYRANGGSYTGGAYIAPGGGSDSSPTDYFLFSYQGSLSYSGGTISFPGQIQSTQSNSTATGGGQIYLNGSNGNRIDFNQNGDGPPTFGTRSAGTKITIYPNISSVAVDYAIGYEFDTLWSSVPNISRQFKWYAGTTNIATLTGAGNLTVTGNVGIGTTNPTDKLHVYGGRLTLDNILSNQSGIQFSQAGSEMAVLYRPASISNQLRMYLTGGGDVMTWNNSGNVGIGITNPAYKLEVSGSFAATTKSFVIPHPTKEGYRLRYGSLEGPENGVYVRGRNNSTTIELPEYWTKLVDPDSITVNLTPIGKTQTLWVESIEGNRVYVGSECSEVEYFYTVFAERADVDRLEVELEG